ncbi:hypothetical protein [Massilia sp. NP310]|uniref:hypothetical protein n=1 Tax=Massilia sp. NP310 TaxID=2861282 RepID=UPI001C62671C|nr:hypothetical protein [Massilia sp. NP310]QYG04029.1 hypothetical protein KY496_11925 [Massilia sp. NP310]
MASKQKRITRTEFASLVAIAKGSGRTDLHDLFKTVALPDGKGARSTSTGGSWVLEINGVIMSSARNKVRRFASLDKLQEELAEIGIPHFIVVNAPCPAGKSIGGAA